MTTRPTTDRLGTVLEDGDRRGLRYVRRLRHPRERVWRALTESDQLRHWFPADIEGDRRDGAPLVLRFWPDHVDTYDIDEPTSAGTLHVWDPPSVFDWSWDTDHLRFELDEDGDGDGCVLTLTVWIDDPLTHGETGSSPDEATGRASAAAGYHACLDHLEALLDDDLRGPLVQTDTAALQATYRDLVG